MKQKTWQKLEKGDWIKYRKNGTPRKILSITKHDGKTGCITLRQIGYSYLGYPDGRRTTVYVTCDCNNFIKVNRKEVKI